VYPKPMFDFAERRAACFGGHEEGLCRGGFMRMTRGSLMGRGAGAVSLMAPKSLLKERASVMVGNGTGRSTGNRENERTDETQCETRR